MPSKQMTILMKNTEPQYSEGSPLLLEACALYLDNASSNCIAQLKWKSFAETPIKAVMIELEPYDAFNEKLSPVTYQYNGLNVNKGISFGDKNGIQIKGSQANSFNVFLKAVAYQNGDIWRNEEILPFKPLPSSKVQQLMGKYFQQYKRELAKLGCEGAAEFTPQRAFGLWQCGCGNWQKEGEKCLHCLVTYADLTAAADKENLERGLIEYAKEQERIRIETQEAEERKLQAEAEERSRIEQKERAEAAKKELARAKTKKICILSGIAATVVIAVVLLLTLLIIPKGHYDKAAKYYSASNWDMATTEFEQAGSYSDAQTMRKESQYQKGLELQHSNNYDEAVAVFEGIYDYKDSSSQYQESIYQGVTNHLNSNDLLYAQQWIPKIRGYRDSDRLEIELLEKREKLTSRVNIWFYYHVVCLKNDGTVYVSGDENSDPVKTVKNWRNIVQIAVGDYIFGLKSDGTVLIAGGNYASFNGYEDVLKWKDIVAISASETDVVGLKSNGTVVCASDFGTSGDLSSWTDIVKIYTGGNRIIGVQSDGNVLCVGAVAHDKGESSSPNVKGWRDIIDFVVTDYDTYGLKRDGTLVAGRNPDRVASWKDIIAIEGELRGDGGSLIGIHSNGTIILTGGTDYDWDSYEDWTDIVTASISPYNHLVGVKRDGRMVAIGDKKRSSEFRVSGWKDVVGVLTSNRMTVGIQNNGNVIVTADDYGHYNGDAVCNLYYADIQ